jgi:hypothetical protein
MTAIAAAPTKERSSDKPLSLKGLFQSPVVATALLGACVTALGWFVGPMVARAAQSHEKTLEVRTTLATDMSKSFTMAVGASQRVASGLIYGPTGDRIQNRAIAQSAYNAGLGRWQVDGGRITAELSARYTGSDIVHEWALYRHAVTRFYRLSAVLPPGTRPYLVKKVRAYFTHMRTKVPWAKSAVPKVKDVKWQILRQNRRFSRSVAYRQTYDQLSTSFLSLGDAFVERIVKLQPKV